LASVSTHARIILAAYFETCDSSPMTHPPSKKQAWFGWCMYDWANSAFATIILSAVLPVYFVALVPDDGALISFLGFSFLHPPSGDILFLSPC